MLPEQRLDAGGLLGAAAGLGLGVEVLVVVCEALVGVGVIGDQVQRGAEDLEPARLDLGGLLAEPVGLVFERPARTAVFIWREGGQRAQEGPGLRLGVAALLAQAGDVWGQGVGAGDDGVGLLLAAGTVQPRLERLAQDPRLWRARGWI